MSDRCGRQPSLRVDLRSFLEEPNLHLALLLPEVAIDMIHRQHLPLADKVLVGVAIVQVEVSALVLTNQVARWSRGSPMRQQQCHSLQYQVKLRIDVINVNVGSPAVAIDYPRIRRARRTQRNLLQDCLGPELRHHLVQIDRSQMPGNFVRGVQPAQLAVQLLRQARLELHQPLVERAHLATGREGHDLNHLAVELRQHRQHRIAARAPSLGNHCTTRLRDARNQYRTGSRPCAKMA
mmetsp:Transcript_74155/g.226858  ORF Transcript_74155/g.226858 Transcript_74155/m.226858 type:complete len:237 (-) Transcript_74155:3-713(-)